MPAAVASRPKPSRASRDTAPPAKKAKLSQTPASTRQNGLRALVNGTASQPPSATTRGAKNARKDRVDEAAVVVGDGRPSNGDVDMEDAGNEVIEISSAEEDSDEESDEAEDTAHDQDAALAVNGSGDHQDGVVDEENADPEEQSFGERLRAQEPESRIVDVESAFADANTDSKALAPSKKARQLAAPSSHSLGTVLTQALRTSDQDLLESCLRVTDVETIYATIERLPSPLVGSLLQKLAERLYKKPGRAGMLMVWVQWSLVSHGGYLASQPQLVKQLATLNKVLKERANGLQPLLSLKGRLDMLQAQLDLRKRNQRKAANDDEEEAVIYVEGQDDFVSSDDESATGDAPTASRKGLRAESDDENESSADEMPTTMEMDDDSEEGSEDSDDLLDDEAEETDQDTGDEMSEPMSDDLEDGEGVSESEEETKPARRSTAARAGLKSRR